MWIFLIKKCAYMSRPVIKIVQSLFFLNGIALILKNKAENSGISWIILGTSWEYPGDTLENPENPVHFFLIFSMLKLMVCASLLFPATNLVLKNPEPMKKSKLLLQLKV